MFTFLLVFRFEYFSQNNQITQFLFIMTDIWKLSPSSEPYFKRCIDAAQPQTDDNKWFKKLKKNQVILAEKSENLNEDCKTDISLSCDIDTEVKIVGNEEISSSEVDEDFYETIDLEPISKVDVLVEECLKHPNIISKLPEKLSTAAIEKLCNHLFEKTDLNETFLNIFIDKIFLALLKQDYSRLSLNLMVKTSNTHPVKFKKVLKLLLKNLEINNKVLLDLFRALDECERLIFMNKIIEIELTTQEFEHHLFTILTAYKYCKKTFQIQNYIEKLVLDNGGHFSSDINFGKLLLTFLQEQKSIATVKNMDKIEKVIESHRTPFKKPCFNVFKEILDKNI